MYLLKIITSFMVLSTFVNFPCLTFENIMDTFYLNGIILKFLKNQQLLLVTHPSRVYKPLVQQQLRVTVLHAMKIL